MSLVAESAAADQRSFSGERRLDPEIPARLWEQLLWEQLKLVRQHQRRLTLEDGTIKRPTALLSMNQFVNSFLALWWPVSRLSRPD